MRFVITRQHHKRYLEVLLELVIVGQILHLFTALLKRQAVVREIDHREAVAAVAQLPVQLAEQIVGLRHGVEVAGRLFGLHKLRIFSPGTIACLRV